ncbi:hypothetical protein LIER_17607 [Lithospermum erythrorhizon]|uniref:Retrotransposon Copia-like N-terminal domain-containing protein n=1 Tax=Lithospermum erythrorhizon TaxID=34254 RepID=A0AAV3QGF7_LITER
MVHDEPPSDGDSGKKPGGDGVSGTKPTEPSNLPDPDVAVLYRRIDPSSPYYLGSNDNPDNVISAIKLTGSNYEEWSRSLRLSLWGWRKFGFVDGTLMKPTNPDFVVDWDAVQSTLVQWIMNTIDPTQKKSIPYFEEAKPLWICYNDDTL